MEYIYIDNPMQEVSEKNILEQIEKAKKRIIYDFLCIHNSLSDIQLEHDMDFYDYYLFGKVREENRKKMYPFSKLRIKFIRIGYGLRKDIAQSPNEVLGEYIALEDEVSRKVALMSY